MKKTVRSALSLLVLLAMLTSATLLGVSAAGELPVDPKYLVWVLMYLIGATSVLLAVFFIIVIVGSLASHYLKDEPCECCKCKDEKATGAKESTEEPNANTKTAAAQESVAEQEPAEASVCVVSEIASEAEPVAAAEEKAAQIAEPEEQPAVTDEIPAEPAEEPKPVIQLNFIDEKEPENAEVAAEAVSVRFRTSFESRYIQSGVLQDYYTAIKNALLSYKGVKARTSWNYESFNKTRVQCAKINIKGNALLVYLALNPADYNVKKYHFTDMSEKPKFAAIPMLMKVKSERGLKYTLELIAEMMKALEIPKGESANVDYHLPYESTEQLAARGLVKVIAPTGTTLGDNATVKKTDVSALLSAETQE